SELTARDFCADHLNARLPLAVNAAAKALRAQLVVVDLTGEKLFDMRAEDLDILPGDAVILVRGKLLMGDRLDFHKYLLLHRDYYITAADAMEAHRGGPYTAESHDWRNSRFHSGMNGLWGGDRLPFRALPRHAKLGGLRLDDSKSVKFSSRP